MVTPTRYEWICHPLVLTVSGGLNLPPLVLGALGFTEWCGYYSKWMVSNAALCGMNMLAALYLVYKVRAAAFGATDEQHLAEVGKEQYDTDSNSNHGSHEDVEVQAPQTAAPNRNGCFSRLLHLRTTSSDRIRRLVCYDGFFATYSILFLFWFFWISEGVQRVRRIDSAPEEDLEGCMPFHDRYMRTSLVCGYSYFIFACVATLASYCGA